MNLPLLDQYPIEGNQFEWRTSNQVTTNRTAIAINAITSKSVKEALASPAEKLVGDNNLRPISFLEKGVSLSKSVAHITIPGQGVATGFLIESNLLLTNNHVFGSKSDAADAVIRFNYQRDLLGNILPTDEYECDPNSYFRTNPDPTLDYTVVRLKGEPGFKWGTISIDRDIDIKEQQDISIIQHPMGMPKQIAISDNEVVYVDDKVIQYLTDTMPGSSGSPVFDDKWRLVALHHSGGWIPEPSNGSTHFRNEGIRISAIAQDLSL